MQAPGLLARQGELTLELGRRERVSRLAQLHSEIGNITEAIASGALRASSALAAPLHGAETERATLAARTEARTAKIADFLPRLAADYIRLAADPETALQRDVDRARHNLRALLGPVRLMPDGSGQFLVAEGSISDFRISSVPFRIELREPLGMQGPPD